MFSPKLTNQKLLTLKERGFTLIELLVVIIIIGILFSWLIGSIYDKGEMVKGNINKTKMKELKSKIEIFQLQYNSLPSSLDDLVRCTEKTGSGCIPLAAEESLTDAFGNKFTYSLENGGRTYRLKSYGADGRDGGDGANFDAIETGP